MRIEVDAYPKRVGFQWLGVSWFKNTSELLIPPFLFEECVEYVKEFLNVGEVVVIMGGNPHTMDVVLSDISQLLHCSFSRNHRSVEEAWGVDVPAGIEVVSTFCVWLILLGCS